MTKRTINLLTILIFLFPIIVTGQWQTHYEQSGLKETPRYSETVEFSKRLAEASPIVQYTVFGKSLQGRDLPLLVLDIDGSFDPKHARDNNKAVIMIMASIHPGEPAGKDAGLMLFRDIAINDKYAELLDNITILFIPIFNADGHERFGPYNRINQNGPKEMGWRTNAVNLNLNRDFLKADTPEMQYFIKLFNQWMPEFLIDCHSTNGADYQYTMTYALETMGNMEPGLSDWTERTYLAQVEQLMKSDGWEIFPYVTFRTWHDPTSGLYRRVFNPMYSTGYATHRNRVGLLLETHMLKPYNMRVESTYSMIVNTMKILAEEHKTLIKLVNEADKKTASQTFRDKPYPVNFQPGPDSTMVEFKGVEFTKKESTLTGGTWYKYHSDKTKTFNLPLFSDQQAVEEVILPEAYIIPVQWVKALERLKLHDVEMTIIEEPVSIEVETYRFDNPQLSARVNEGRQTVQNISFESYTEKKEFPAGSAVIDMNQKGARLITHALEPQAPGSFLYWGFFNPIFQRTEYFETYAMEEIARQMLDEDPELKERFQHKMETDKEFAQSGQRAILDWFYRQTPYVDQEYMVYPVRRITDRGVLSGIFIN